MTKVLQGIRVLNTRPKKQGQQLSAEIIKAGGVAIDCPTIAIQASDNQWINKLPDLAKINQAIFISANAVEHCFKVLQEQNIRWPKSLQVIAIGDGTAQALKKYGIKQINTPKRPDSEHLLLLPSLKNSQQSLLLFKGEGGRTLIEDVLLQKKAQLIILPVYKRVLPKISDQFLNSLWRDDAVDIILLTSEQSIHNLFTLFNPDAHAWLCNKTCLVISERLAQIASSVGIKKIRVSHPNQIINALIDYKDEFMANSNEQKNIEPASTNANEEAAINNAPSVLNPKTPLMSVLTLIVAFIALVIGLYSYFDATQLNKQLTDENKKRMQEINQLKEQQETLQNQTRSATKDIEQAQEQLENKITFFDKQLNTVSSQHETQNQDWLLFKARYFLELAQINAHWSANDQSSIALLNQADVLLSKTNHPDIFNIRQIIAKEISNVKAIKPLDVAGLLSQFDALQEQVNSLKLEANPAEQNVSDANEIPAKNLDNWRAQVQESMHLLSKLVVIRRNDENIKPLLSPLFASLLKESIRLNIQEAQWAIINNNEMAYQLAVKQIITNLKRGFNKQATEALLTQLSDLQKITFKQEQPAIGQALPLLNQLIDKKNTFNNQVDNNDNGGN